MMKTAIALCIVLFCTLINHPITNSQDRRGQSTQVGFRYIIFKNEVDDTGRPHDTWRRLKVLLETDRFSEDTLTSLFYLLSKRFPQPEWLEAEVYTSLNQVQTPEEEDEGQISGSSGNPEIDHYHRAILIRIQGNELYRYNPNTPNKKLKTVILRGKDPFGPNK